jgi:hypothetical protein
MSNSTDKPQVSSVAEARRAEDTLARLGRIYIYLFFFSLLFRVRLGIKS